MKKEKIRTIYLYLFSAIGLILLIFGSVRFMDMGLRAVIFTQADSVERVQRNHYIAPVRPLNLEVERYEDDLTDEELYLLRSMIEDYEKQKQDWDNIDHYAAGKQREASSNLALIIVGLPLFLYHWHMIKKDQEE